MLKTLDLRDETLREELGLRTVSTPSQKPARQEKRPMGESMAMIRDHVLNHPFCTRLEISRALGRAKSPYILGQIEMMVRNGTLARSIQIRPNGAIEYRYIVVDDNGY